MLTLLFVFVVRRIVLSLGRKKRKRVVVQS